MRFVAINLEQENGPFARAIHAIKEVRDDLRIRIRNVGDLREFTSELQLATLHRGGALPDRSPGAWRTEPGSPEEATDTFVFVDLSMRWNPEEIERALMPFFRRRVDGLTPSALPSPAVLFHSQHFAAHFRALARECEEKLLGLFVYRGLADLGYGSSGAAFTRLQYAIEGLFSTNWTRLSAREPLSGIDRSSDAPPAVYESRQRNNRLEPFDDHGPFLSEQIHDISRISTLMSLGSVEEAVHAFITDHEREALATNGLSETSSIEALLGVWRGTRDFGRRSRRFRAILRLYGDSAPYLEPETIACFDRTRFPVWLSGSTLQIQNVDLITAVTDFQDVFRPEMRSWGLHWLRAAECYLRRLREQVIT